jgi:hypothetical protein
MTTPLVTSGVSRKGINNPLTARDGLTVADVERRMHRAICTINALPDPERRFQVMHNLWPQMVRSSEEAYGYEEERAPRFKPTPADVSDCLVALAWARAINRADFRVVRWRAHGFSYRWISTRLHRSHEHVRQRYRDIVLRLWERACQ